MRANLATQLIRAQAACALALSIIVLAACSSQANAPPAPDAFVVLQNIPAANPTKYADLREKKNWQNPYLVVRADGVGLLTGVTANQERMLKPEEVLDALARLPSSAWPYGRVTAILVQEPSGGSEQSSERNSEQQKVALRRNRGTVAGELERAHVEIVWMAPTP
ncbi:MAG: hypothetical protein WBQ08_13740 [Candidatus Sulfotelmatobacter sp.]